MTYSQPKRIFAGVLALILSTAAGFADPPISVLTFASKEKPYHIKSADLGPVKQIIVDNTLDKAIEVSVSVSSVLNGQLMTEERDVVRVVKPKSMEMLFNVAGTRMGPNPTLTYTDSWRLAEEPKSEVKRPETGTLTLDQINSKPPVFNSPSPFKTMKEALDYAKEHPGEWVNAPNGAPLRLMDSFTGPDTYAKEREAFMEKYNKEHPEGGAHEAWKFERSRLEAEHAQTMREVRIGRDGKVTSERLLSEEEKKKIIRPRQ